MKHILSILSSSFVLASLAPATVVIDFGGDMVSGHQNFDLGSLVESPTGVYGWYRTGATPLIANSSNYTGPTLYGIIQQEGEVASGGFYRVRNLDVDDVFQNRTFSPLDITSYSLGYVKKSDFLNGMSEVSNLSLKGQDAISMNVSTLFGNGTSTRLVHFVVQNGTDWYISSASVTAAGVLSIDNGQTSTWAPWSIPPATGGLFPSVPTEFAVLGSDLTDIQAVGVWSRITATHATSNAVADFQFASFEVAVIPEPGAVAAVMGLLVVGLVLIRRRRA